MRTLRTNSAPSAASDSGTTNSARRCSSVAIALRSCSRCSLQVDSCAYASRRESAASCGKQHDRAELGALLDQAPALRQPGSTRSARCRRFCSASNSCRRACSAAANSRLRSSSCSWHAEAVRALALLAHLAPRVFVGTHGLVQQPLAARPEQLVGFLRQRVQRFVDAGRAGAGLEQALAEIAVAASELLAADAQAFVIEAEHAREHRLRQSAEHARERRFVGGSPLGSSSVFLVPLRRTNASSCPRASTRRAPMRRFGPVCRYASRLWCSMPYRKPTIARSVVLLPASFGP